MQYLVWVIAVLAFVFAAWFVYDGLRVLITGDYVTPGEGKHAGQLGPWSGAVRAVGIEPRSTLLKSVFVVYGAVWICIIAGFLFRQPWAWVAMLIAAIGSVWYLPFGTVIGIIQIVLLLILRFK
jgi:hypothetical protein